MSESYQPGEVIATAAFLRSAPVATVVETGEGFRYVRKINGRWACPGVSRNAPPGWLLDPEHSRQPISVRYIP